MTARQAPPQKSEGNMNNEEVGRLERTLGP